MNIKVLFVDDDDNILASVHRHFHKRYKLDVASGGPQALRAMEEHGPYAVVVADMAMPGMNGIEFLQQAMALAPDTVRIMFTGHPGPLTLLEAINSGQVFRFVTKPCPPEELSRVVDAGLQQYRMLTAERELLESTLTGSLEAMTGMLELLDPVTYSAARTLADRAARVARAMGAGEAWAIRLAALFSPLWSAPPPATESERTAARDRAVDILLPIPRLEPVARLIDDLGKPFDGRDDPPLRSRILKALLDFAVVDGRVKSGEVALEELRLKGLRYDPQVLAAMAGVLNLTLHDH